MARNPSKPFNDTANLTPIRDIDNAGNVPKTPSFAKNLHPKLAPIGSMGIRRSSDAQIANQGSKRVVDFAASYPEKDGWQHVTNAETKQAYIIKQTDLPSDKNMNGGTISQLIYFKDQTPVAEFDQGWKTEPQTQSCKGDIKKVCDLLDPPDKEFRPIDHNKGHDHER